MLDLTLFVPGLFDSEIDTKPGSPSELPTLEFLLARASKSAMQGESYNSALSSLFAYTRAEGRDVPVAAIGRLIDADSKPEGCWMRADPVHLLARQHSLSLLDASSFPLTQHDALALAACVRESFTERGWELEVPVPTRWYVHIKTRPSIQTSEIQEVTGQDIQLHMPRGDDAAGLHQLLNEVQMGLHAAEINKLRVERGELPVNSLWFWGAGVLPGLLERRWSRVYSDDNTTLGLSMLSNTPCLPLPAETEDVFAQPDEQANILVVLSEFQPGMLQRQQRQQQLLQFEKDWCCRLLQKLRAKSLHSLRIITRSRTYTLSRMSLLKFWKRAQVFNSYVT